MAAGIGTAPAKPFNNPYSPAEQAAALDWRQAAFGGRRSPSAPSGIPLRAPVTPGYPTGHGASVPVTRIPGRGASASLGGGSRPTGRAGTYPAPSSYPYQQPTADSPASQPGLLNPTDVTSSTPVNPMEGYAYDRAKAYESGLANMTNEETVRELGRYRDEISTGMQAEGEAAMGRGVDPSLFRSRALESGKRNLSNLQARLADVSLGRREGALGQLTSAAGSAAGGQRSMIFGTLAARLAEQRALQDRAAEQERMNQAQYQRLLEMMQTMGQYGGMYGGGGGMASGGGGMSGGGGGGGWGAR